MIIFPCATDYRCSKTDHSLQLNPVLDISLDSDEAQKNGGASNAVSEESVNDAETQHTPESVATVKETPENTIESTDNVSAKGSKSSLAALDQVNIAINGEIIDTPSDLSTNLLENVQSAEVNNSESDLLLAQDDGNLADNETESDVKDIECERTSEAKASGEDESKEQCSDSEGSDFVDAKAINGIEMLPSSVLNDDDSEESGKIDSSKEQSSKEKEENSHQETPLLSTNDAPKDSLTENTESSNEESHEEPELQLLSDGSQDDLLPSSADTAADSSSYETPRSSEASPSTTSANQSEAITTQPTVTINGVSSRNSVTDSAPIPPPRKGKKKGVPKGLSSSSLGGCFPMACAGNMSPTFNLSRIDSVYGGSVRSRSVSSSK